MAVFSAPGVAISLVHLIAVFSAPGAAISLVYSIAAFSAASVAFSFSLFISSVLSTRRCSFGQNYSMTVFSERGSVQYGELPNIIRANNKKTLLVSNNKRIKMFTRKFGSAVNPPTDLIPPIFITLYYSTYFITLIATETHRCYWGDYIFLSYCYWGN